MSDSLSKEFLSKSKNLEGGTDDIEPKDTMNSSIGLVIDDHDWKVNAPPTNEIVLPSPVSSIDHCLRQINNGSYNEHRISLDDDESKVSSIDKSDDDDELSVSDSEKDFSGDSFVDTVTDIEQECKSSSSGNVDNISASSKGVSALMIIQRDANIPRVPSQTSFSPADASAFKHKSAGEMTASTVGSNGTYSESPHTLSARSYTSSSSRNFRSVDPSETSDRISVSSRGRRHPLLDRPCSSSWASFDEYSNGYSSGESSRWRGSRRKRERKSRKKSTNLAKNRPKSPIAQNFLHPHHHKAPQVKQTNACIVSESGDDTPTSLDYHLMQAHAMQSRNSQNLPQLPNTGPYHDSADHDPRQQRTYSMDHSICSESDSCRQKKPQYLQQQHHFEYADTISNQQQNFAYQQSQFPNRPTNQYNQPIIAHEYEFPLKFQPTQYSVNQRPVDRKPSRISFSTIEIRFYDRILGDNPSCSNGPSLSIGWNYDVDNVIRLPLDKFEYMRSDRLDGPELVISRIEREEMLEELGYKERDIAEAVRSNIRAKNQRRQTINNLSVMPVEEIIEKASRKMKRVFRRKGRKKLSSENQILKSNNFDSESKSSSQSVSEDSSTNSFRRKTIIKSNSFD